MVELEDTIELDGLICARSPTDPHHYFYWPTAPTAERDEAGRPQIMLVQMGSAGSLQLATRWGPEAAQLEAARAELARRERADPALIRLTHAPVSVRSATLRLGNGTAEVTDLQTSETSGIAPYSAVFSVSLTAAQTANVIAALNGRKGFLQVHYDIALPAEVAVTVELTGDVRAEVAELAAGEGDAAALVRRAIANGRLQVAQHGPADAPAELWAKARLIAESQAAEALRALAAGTATDRDPTALRVSAEVRANLSRPLPQATDVGDWFAQGGGLGHMQFANVAHPQRPQEEDQTPDAETLTVELAFDPTDAPLALVTVAQGESQVRLKPPRFDCVELPATAATLLTLTTQYTTGGAPYTAELTPPTAAVRLQPGDLGLARVVVDATARAETAERLRVTLRYQPEGEGERDTRTLYLEGKNGWQAGYFLITRGDGLAGWLEMDVKESLADGRVVKHDPVKTSDPEITL